MSCSDTAKITRMIQGQRRRQLVLLASDLRLETRRCTGATTGVDREAAAPHAAQPARLVFIDETAVNTKMTRLRGRSRRGQRLRASAPFGRWGTQTFIAALRCDGLTSPWVVNGAMDRAAFNAYVETQLAPTLRPGDVV